jgi:seryl-tRNA synthetase
VIDVRLLRTDLDGVRKALGRRGIDLAEVERAAALDEELRGLATRRDDLRGQKNAISKEVGAAKRNGDNDKADRLAAESRSLDDELGSIEPQAAEIEETLRSLLLRIPNIPAGDAPDGRGEEDNPVLRTAAFDPAAFGDHQRVPHWETGEALGILDLERAVKISGSMFTMLRREGATLARALCQAALDRNADAYEEVRPPTLVTSETLTATGQLPKFADDAYQVERDDLWTIPTAEVPLTSLARNEVLAEADLPTKLMAYTPCYRREAGAAGRDTRGLLRTHEFDKVELLAYATAEQAPAVLDDILGRATAFIEALGLPYRVLDICTGDMGQSHHRSFDVEVYAPGVDKWLEVSSCSWFSDYQARRANIRYRPSAGGSPQFVHTLNGSALAVPRVLAAILEIYRQPDGSVRVPEVLHPYMRGTTTIAAR